MKNHLKLRTPHRGSCPQRHILRDRRPSTATCQACWAMGQSNWNNVRRGKNYFVLKLNSWTYISVEVSGHNLESSQTWGFRIMSMNSGSWLIRAAKAEKKSLVPGRQAQRTNQGRTPFICTLWVPIHLSFNSHQGPPLFSLSGCAPEVDFFLQYNCKIGWN